MAKKEKLSPDELLEQALVKEEEQPYAVPDNWVWTKLNHICNKITDGEHIKPILATNGIPLLTAKNILDDEIDFTKVDYVDFTVANKSWERCHPQEDDILICSRGTIGRNTIISHNTKFCLMGTVILLKVGSDFIVPKYANFAIKTEVLQNLMKNLCGSTAVSALYLKDIKKIPFPLPPLPEQQRIVAVIESLFEKLDRAKELAQNALDSFDNRKSAILHKAFTGELTRKWREENECKKADEIINEVYNYRLALKEKIADKEKGQTIFNYQEANSNDNLPKNWRYTSLEKLCESFQYGTSKKSDDTGSFVVVRMGNLQSGKIDWSNLAFTSDDVDIKKYALKKGDVLFNRTNSPELVGKTSIYEGEMPAIFAGYLIRIKNYEYLDSHYLNYVMNTTYAKEYCMKVKSDGVNQSNINAQKLAKFEIPLCSLPEQQEIVRILDNLLENEQKAKELCDVIDKIDHMKKSILARAFRGELDTNNPAEESALGLLKEVLKAKA